MLAHLIEHCLAFGINRSRTLLVRRREPPSPSPTPDGHILIGHPLNSSDRPHEPITISAADRQRHLYILGATGSGKTSLQMRLIDGDIRDRRSVCIIDLRGDLIDRVLVRLAATETPESLDGRLVLLDLRRTDRVVPLNLLLGEGDLYTRALHLLEVFQMQAESWGVQLEETLRNSLIALAESGWSVLELDQLLSNAAFRSEVLKQVTDPYVKSFFDRYDRLSVERQLTWRLPVINKVTALLSIPVLRAMFGQRRTISFRRLLDSSDGTILLVALGAHRFHQVSLLVGGLIVSALQAAVMSRADLPEDQRPPVYLYVDEFQGMATPRFETIISEGRRFGLGLCLSHQNLEQLSTGLRHTVLNNAHVQIFLQTGALDAVRLANEVTASEPKDAVRSLLIGQRVGEAFVVRRGHPSVRVRLAYTPDPQVAPEAVAVIREEALRRHARSIDEVQREIAERTRTIEGPISKAPGRSREEHKISYVIRNDKQPGQFKAQTP